MKLHVARNDIGPARTALHGIPRGDPVRGRGTMHEAGEVVAPGRGGRIIRAGRRKDRVPGGRGAHPDDMPGVMVRSTTIKGADPYLTRAVRRSRGVGPCAPRAPDIRLVHERVRRLVDTDDANVREWMVGIRTRRP